LPAIVEYKIPHTAEITAIMLSFTTIAFTKIIVKTIQRPITSALFQPFN